MKAYDQSHIETVLKAPQYFEQDKYNINALN